MRERLEYPYCDVDIIRSKAASKARPEAMMRCIQPTKDCLIINQDAFDAVVGLKGIKMESMDTSPTGVGLEAGLSKVAAAATVEPKRLRG